MHSDLDDSYASRETSKDENGLKYESLDIIHEISQVLNTGLDRQLLDILVHLCQCGVDPNALAYIVKHLKAARHEFLRNAAHSAQKP